MGPRPIILIGSALLICVAALIGVERYGDWLKRDSACYWGLEDIDIAKQYWALDHKKDPGAQVSFADLIPKYLTAMPTCDEGGTYVLGPIGSEPTCSHAGHWHRRQYYLNYASPSLVVGKNVYFAGISHNSPKGAFVDNGQETYRLEGVRRWPRLKTDCKITVFGRLVRKGAGTNEELVVENPEWQSKWTRFDAANACLNNLRQIDGAKQQWALENHKTLEDAPSMEELLVYVKCPSGLSAYPRCDSGGIYIVERVDKSPRCTLHTQTLDNIGK